MMLWNTQTRGKATVRTCIILEMRSAENFAMNVAWGLDDIDASATEIIILFRPPVDIIATFLPLKARRSMNLVVAPFPLYPICKAQGVCCCSTNPSHILLDHFVMIKRKQRPRKVTSYFLFILCEPVLVLRHLFVRVFCFLIPWMTSRSRSRDIMSSTSSHTNNASPLAICYYLSVESKVVALVGWQNN